ncbi:hypothetical protein U0070_021622, partial [Myodes glareolus]
LSLPLHATSGPLGSNLPSVLWYPAVINAGWLLPLKLSQSFLSPLHHLVSPVASPVLGIDAGTYCAQHEGPQRTVMCSNLGHAGVQQGVLSAECVLFMGETCSCRSPSLVRGIHGYILVPEGKAAWTAEYGFNRKFTKEDVFVHQTALKNTPRKYLLSIGVGETVGVDIVEGEKGVEASNIAGPGGVPAPGTNHNHCRCYPPPWGVLHAITSKTTRIVRVGKRMRNQSMLPKARANMAALPARLQVKTRWAPTKCCNPPVEEVMDGADKRGAGEAGRPVTQRSQTMTSAGSLLAKDDLERTAMKGRRKIKEMRLMFSSHLNNGVAATSMPRKP